MINEFGISTKITFSGHDSFQCRQLWLKKGYDFVREGNNFNQEDAVVKLGVGKNMVSSIRFWLKAFNVIDQKDEPTEFGQKMFELETGYDPYLEDEASLWLLHYQLIKTGFATTYSLIFNEFRKEKLFFSAPNYVAYVKRLAESNEGVPFNENTLTKDFTVFANVYKNDSEGKDVEDSFSGILSELDLLKSQGRGNDMKYRIENLERDNVPAAMLLFAILDNDQYGLAIGLNTLEHDWNSPGSIFALSRSGILNKISEIVSEYAGITFADQAGIKELQFRTKINPFEILESYYER